MSKGVDQVQLVEKSIPIFWANGYRSVTNKKLAEGIGISSSFLYNQLGKQQLFLDSLNSYLTRDIDPFFEEVKNAENGLEVIRGVYYHLADAKYNNEPCTCMIMNIALELRHEVQGLDQVYTRFHTSLRDAFGTGIRNTQKNFGGIDVEKIPVYTEMVFSVLYGLNFLAEFKTSDDLKDYIDSQFALIT